MESGHKEKKYETFRQFYWELYNRQILAYFIVYILLHYHGDFIEEDKMLYKKWKCLYLETAVL